jgi:hypothetical protein
MNQCTQKGDKFNAKSVASQLSINALGLREQMSSMTLVSREDKLVASQRNDRKVFNIGM